MLIIHLKILVDSIVIDRHDVASVAGLTAMSFGMDGIDRYIVVFKKDHGPSEDEVLARRNGEQWNEEKAKEYAQKVRFSLKGSYLKNLFTNFRLF